MSGGVLVAGRAVHAPWNEGTRVIARTIAEAASRHRPVTLVSLTRPEFVAEDTGEIEALRIVARGGYGIRGDYASLSALARELDAIVSRERPAVAHLVGLPLLVAPMIRRHGTRVVSHVTLTQHAYQGAADRARAAAARRILDRAVDVYAAAADPIRLDLIASGLDPDRVLVVPPPVMADVFSPADRDAARRVLGIPSGRPVVVYVGTVSPLRFPARDIAAALAVAQGTVGPVHLRVYAPVRTHAYNATWAEDNVGQAMREAGIDVSIELRDLSEREKVLVFSAAEVVFVPFAAPVAVEPPLTLLEAMACAASVLVSPHANRSSVVTSGETGVEFASRDELAGGLCSILGSGSAGRAAMGERARAAVVARFGPDAIDRAILRVWKRAGVQDMNHYQGALNHE